MEIEQIFLELKKYKDINNAKNMSAYMLNQFEYLGIRTQQRRRIFGKIFKSISKEEQIDWSFINKCWENQYRELQYIALDYIKKMEKYLTDKDIPRLKKLILTKSWWDTIDNLDRIVGGIALKYPEVNKTILRWSTDNNIWLRRIAINHQLLRKEKTDIKLLEKIIKNNLNQTEFFINKAIGWALRDYSKTNPKWVKNFINENKDKMAKLSIRESSKYI